MVVLSKGNVYIAFLPTEKEIFGILSKIGSPEDLVFGLRQIYHNIEALRYEFKMAVANSDTDNLALALGLEGKPIYLGVLECKIMDHSGFTYKRPPNKEIGHDMIYHLDQLIPVLEAMRVSVK